MEVEEDDVSEKLVEVEVVVQVGAVVVGIEEEE